MARLALVIAILFGAAAHAGPTITPDVVYGHKAGMALTYDVIAPPDRRNGAGVVFMMSGGWFSSWSPPERLASGGGFSGLLDRGFTLFIVRHGSAPRFKVPEAVSDVRAAVRHIRATAANHGVDADRLGVFGGSAGGHLSLMLGLSSEVEPWRSGQRRGPRYLESSGPAPLAAVVAYYPPTDIRGIAGPSERFPALDFDPDLSASISPILFVTEDDPPTRLMHGDADTLVDVSASHNLEEVFEKQGLEHDLVVIEGGDHGFRNPEHRASAEAAMIDWFVEHLSAE